MIADNGYLLLCLTMIVLVIIGGIIWVSTLHNRLTSVEVSVSELKSNIDTVLEETRTTNRLLDKLTTKVTNLHNVIKANPPTEE